jgi:hypothetical protein
LPHFALQICDSLAVVASSAFPLCPIRDLIGTSGDEFAMNFAAFITNLKSGLTRSCSKEHNFNNELRRTPLWRSSQNLPSGYFSLTKGEKQAGWRSASALLPLAAGTKLGGRYVRGRWTSFAKTSVKRCLKVQFLRPKIGTLTSLRLEADRRASLSYLASGLLASLSHTQTFRTTEEEHCFGSRKW